MSDLLWNNEQSISDFDIQQPEWITQDLSCYDVAGINQGGCASGAYMPAVTYYTALGTMSEHGNDVLQYIEDTLGELPTIPQGESWSGIAVFFLSYAVELYCQSIESELTDHLQEIEDLKECE